MSENDIAVVFDFDGTLIDSKEVKIENYVRAFYDIFRVDARFRETVYESCRHTAGANRFVQLEDTLNRLGIEATEEERERWSKRYSELNRESLSVIGEFPSVRGLLEKLKERGFSIFAASGILHEEFRRELEKRNLAGYFKEIKGGDKEGFLKSLKERNFKRIIFVGDTKYDGRAAEKAGVEFFKIENNDDILRLSRILSP